MVSSEFHQRMEPFEHPAAQNKYFNGDIGTFGVYPGYFVARAFAGHL